MKHANPPFDPPYVSIHQTEQGATDIERLADATTRSLSAGEADWTQTGEVDPVTA